MDRMKRVGQISYENQQRALFMKTPPGWRVENDRYVNERLALRADTLLGRENDGSKMMTFVFWDDGGGPLFAKRLYTAARSFGERDGAPGRACTVENEAGTPGFELKVFAGGRAECDFQAHRGCHRAPRRSRPCSRASRAPRSSPRRVDAATRGR